MHIVPGRTGRQALVLIHVWRFDHVGESAPTPALSFGVTEERADTRSIDLDRTSAVPVIPPFSSDSFIDLGDCDVGQGEMVAEKPPQEIFDTPTPALYRLF